MSEEDESNKRHFETMQIAPAEWDRRPMAFMTRLRALLDEHMKDEGTVIDSGFGDGMADLWIKHEGIEYFISARRSNNSKLI